MLYCSLVYLLYIRSKTARNCHLIIACVVLHPIVCDVNAPGIAFSSPRNEHALMFILNDMHSCLVAIRNGILSPDNYSLQRWHELVEFDCKLHFRLHASTKTRCPWPVHVPVTKIPQHALKMRRQRSIISLLELVDKSGLICISRTNLNITGEDVQCFD